MTKNDYLEDLKSLKIRLNNGAINARKFNKQVRLLADYLIQEGVE